MRMLYISAIHLIQGHYKRLQYNLNVQHYLACKSHVLYNPHAALKVK